MFHIVFDSRGAELLSAAMDMDEALDGETILIRDDFSVGPIQDLFSDEGRANVRNGGMMISQEVKSRIRSNWQMN